MSKRSKACKISKKVKKIVYERDKGRCIICNKPGMPNSHFISRAHGGLGIEENITTMCMKCHDAYDNGKDYEYKQYIKKKTEQYLKSKYDEWDKEKLIYKKY